MQKNINIKLIILILIFGIFIGGCGNKSNVTNFDNSYRLKSTKDNFYEYVSEDTSKFSFKVYKSLFGKDVYEVFGKTGDFKGYIGRKEGYIITKEEKKIEFDLNSNKTIKRIYSSHEEGVSKEDYDKVHTMVSIIRNTNPSNISFIDVILNLIIIAFSISLIVFSKYLVNKIVLKGILPRRKEKLVNSILKGIGVVIIVIYLLQLIF